MADKSDTGRNDTSRPSSDDLKRRGDNVGQSGRWRRADGTEGDEVARHYGHEERWHSTEHPTGPAEPPHKQPSDDKPNASPYQGRFAPPEEGERRGDDKSGHRDKGYADAGGKGERDVPQHPGERWSKEGGAGFGEDYGVGRDATKSDSAGRSEKP